MNGDKGNNIVGGRVAVVSCGLSVVGLRAGAGWVLAVGYWVLAIGCWLLDVGEPITNVQ